MTPHTTIRIDDELPPRQTAVPLRPADHETPRRINVELRFRRYQRFRQRLFDHEIHNRLVNRLFCHLRAMLRRTESIDLTFPSA